MQDYEQMILDDAIKTSVELDLQCKRLKSIAIYEAAVFILLLIGEYLWLIGA